MPDLFPVSVFHRRISPQPQKHWQRQWHTASIFIDSATQPQSHECSSSPDEHHVSDRIRPPSTSLNLPENQADSTVLSGGSDLRADLSPDLGPISMPISNMQDSISCRRKKSPIFQLFRLLHFPAIKRPVDLKWAQTAVDMASIE